MSAPWYSLEFDGIKNIGSAWLLRHCAIRSNSVVWAIRNPDADAPFLYFCAFVSELYSLQVRSGSIAVVVSGGSRELARVKQSLKRLKRSQKVKRVHWGRSVAFTVVDP